MASALVWRSRLSRLAGIWATIALVEWATWRYFLRSAFYRDFFLPVTVLVVIVGLAASWRVLGRRYSDRRARERRRGRRRQRAAPPE